jgi:chromosome segregation ATPase
LVGGSNLVLSEEEVRKSFARVKDDILQIKRSLNKQLFSVESLNKSVSSNLPKDEFYTFVQRLGSKMEEIENSFSLKSDKTEIKGLVFELQKEIASLRKIVEKREDITEDLKQIRSLKGKMLELEGMAVSRPDFSKEISKIKSEIDSFKIVSEGNKGEISSLLSSISNIEKRIASIAANVNSLSSTAIPKDEMAAFTGRMELAHQDSVKGFSSLKKETDKKISEMDKKVSSIESFQEKLTSLSGKLADAERNLAEITESSRKFAERKSVEKEIAQLNSKINETKQSFESSVSEVNIEEYVTKRALKQQISGLSDSIKSSVSGSVSENFRILEGEISSIRNAIGSSSENNTKQLDKEFQKFAQAKELNKIKEEIESLRLADSAMVSADEFNDRIEKISGDSESTTEDFKKELKRQREMFESKLESLESFYRTSNDSLKSELDDIKDHIKGLTKANAEAKSEIAKVSVSASKAAAKTATEILDEIERENVNGRRGKGWSTMVWVLLILAVLALGTITYVVLNGPGIDGNSGTVQKENFTMLIKENLSPITLPAASERSDLIELPLDNSSDSATESLINKSATSAVSNLTQVEVIPPITEDQITESNISKINATESTINRLNISKAPVNLNQSCKDKLECTKRTDGAFWFDCYYDQSLGDCRCFVGSSEDCPQAKGENISETPKSAEEAKAPGAKYYAIVAFIILAVAFFAYRTLFVKEPEDNHKSKPKAHEKLEEKGVVDLEEFFEKKETKKK